MVLKGLRAICCYCLFAFGPGLLAQPAPTRLADITYGTSGQTLDLWIPAKEHKRSVLLFIHGGGFKTGNKEQMQVYSKLYAQGGFVSATINYRLTSSPGNEFPAGLNDVREALVWLQTNASIHNFDPKKIIAIGYSAGANLSLMAGLDNPTKLAGVVSAAGPTDLPKLVATATMTQLAVDMASYLGKTPGESASPFYRVRRGAPPTLFLHGDQDNFVPIAQALTMAQKLQEAEVPVLMKVVTNVGHEIFLPTSIQKTVLETLTAFILSIEQAKP